ncbi:TMEM175 family protein [Lacibacter sediminis]|uniref:DUF1211 domain-containing protein n=1 Tax=Lacibacter sediminis TaxID=2760713 RepID=A0A7G5XL61_9BACT|nr:TMEM175 family protein [Lacibacter sediminis]QNA46214.1 DUF1211 domain-containing protein [Lacibacter sediminis]
MQKNRLEAFSDGVLAIIITIMVMELKVPHNPSWQSYIDAYPVFASYALSFVFVGLYWSNHHHLFHAASKVNNKILWLNMFVLFWESLIPFVTSSMGENHFANITVTMYALVMTASTIAHMILVNGLCRLHGVNSAFSKAYKGHSKSYVTIAVNLSAALLALMGFPKLAFCVMAVMAIAWFLPNHRVQS